MPETEAQKAAEAAQRDRALSVACPVCHAGGGFRCINTATNQPGNIVHLGRVIAWERGHRG